MEPLTARHLKKRKKSKHAFSNTGSAMHSNDSIGREGMHGYYYYFNMFYCALVCKDPEG